MEPITLTLNEEGKIKDVDVVAWIMNEINDPAFTREDVVKTYAKLIEKHHEDWKTEDWTTINDAILKRWNKSGLNWIRIEAWKHVSLCAMKAGK